MTGHAQPGSRSKLSVWLQAVRTFSFPVSVVPVILAGVLALSFDGHVAWELFPLVLVCAVLYHGGGNIVSDYFDHKRGVDRDYTFGSSRVIVEGLLTPRQVLMGGLVLLALGTALGLVLVAYRGVPILILGAIGLVGTYFYTAEPIGYKYYGLGDFMVFLFFGPLMVIGAYLALTGSYQSSVLWASVPIGLLTMAVLNANNVRDIAHDGAARVKTTAHLFGYTAARAEYFVLVLGAYLTVVILAATRVFTPLSLAVFVTLPVALKNLRAMAASHQGKPEEIAMLDVRTAQLHLMFGLIFAVALVVGRLI